MPEFYWILATPTMVWSYRETNTSSPPEEELLQDMARYIDDNRFGGATRFLELQKSGKLRVYSVTEHFIECVENCGSFVDWIPNEFGNPGWPAHEDGARMGVDFMILDEDKPFDDDDI